MHTEQPQSSAIAAVLWAKKICPICDKEFSPQKHNQVYCTMDCKTIARKMREGDKRIFG